MDMNTWGAGPQRLEDPSLGLIGKPDYIVKEGDAIIPVEVKSRPIAERPYESHIFQMAAYCRLINSHFGKRPHYGILHYPNRTFRVQFSQELENQLIHLIVLMQKQATMKNIPRSHESPARCRACGYNHICDQRLI